MQLVDVEVAKASAQCEGGFAAFVGEFAGVAD